MDRIVLEGMIFSGRHGVGAEEREHSQDFVVDVEIETDVAHPARTDKLEDTIDYTNVRSLAKGVIEGESANLIETLAEQIAGRILELPKVSAVSVRVAKRPPSMMPISRAAVHIRRTRA